MASNRIVRGIPILCVALLFATRCTASTARQRWPPRVLGHPHALTVAVYGGAPTHYQRTVHIRNQHDIVAVVKDINAMHHLANERGFSCGLRRTLWYEILTFGYPHAASLRVHVYATCPPTARARGILAGGDQAFVPLAHVIDRLIGRNP